MLRTLAATCLLVGMAASAADAQVTLTRKFPEEGTQSRSIDTSTKQTLVIAGMNVDTSSQQNMVVSTKIGKRNAAGELSVEYKVESLQQMVKAPGLGEVNFDSANPDKATESPLTPIFKAASQATWTMTLDRENRVASVSGRDKAFESLDENLREAMKASFDPAKLKAAAQVELDRIPTKAVKAGDSWEQDEVQQLEGGQSLTLHKKYTYHGPVNHDGRKVHQIDVSLTKVTLAIEGANAANLTLKKSDLKPGASSGKLLFDEEAGELVSDKQVHQIKGQITLAIAGQELPAELDLTLDTSVVARR